VASTYEPIASVTTSSSAATVTFDNIPGIYTDIIVVSHSGLANNNGVSLKINDDTGTNYSSTRLTGNGSSAASARRSSTATVYAVGEGLANASTVQNVSIVTFMSYANTSVYKTWLQQEAAPASGAGRGVGLWRSTSAITKLVFTAAGTTFVNGSTFSLFGIKAAV